MRIKLRSNIERGRDWSITSYHSYTAQRSMLAITIDEECPRDGYGSRRLLMDKAKEEAIASGYTLNAGWGIEKFPPHFTAPGMFWVDFGATRHVNAVEGMYHVGGMYPYDWGHIHTVIGAANVREKVYAAKYRGRLTVGAVTVPLFWYPYLHARHGTETLMHYMRSRNLPMEGKHAEYFR